MKVELLESQNKKLSLKILNYSIGNSTPCNEDKHIAICLNNTKTKIKGTDIIIQLYKVDCSGFICHTIQCFISSQVIVLSVVVLCILYLYSCRISRKTASQLMLVMFFI